MADTFNDWLSTNSDAPAAPPAEEPAKPASFGEWLNKNSDAPPTQPSQPQAPALPPIKPHYGDQELRRVALNHASQQSFADLDTKKQFVEDTHNRLRAQQLTSKMADNSAAIHQALEFQGSGADPRKIGFERARYVLNRLGGSPADDVTTGIFEEKAANRIKEGKGTANDYDIIGRKLAMQDYQANRGLARYGADFASQLPAGIAQWVVTPGAKSLGLAGQGVKGVVTAAVAGGGLRTALRPDKLLEGVEGGRTPQVGIQDGKLAVQDAEGGWKGLGKAALAEFLSNTAFEGVGFGGPKQLSLRGVAAGTGKLIGASEAAKEVGGHTPLIGSGQGGVVSALVKAKDSDEQLDILAKAGIEIGVFGTVEALMGGIHGAKRSGVSDKAIEKNIERGQQIAEAAKPETATGPVNPTPPDPYDQLRLGDLWNLADKNKVAVPQRASREILTARLKKAGVVPGGEETPNVQPAPSSPTGPAAAPTPGTTPTPADAVPTPPQPAPAQAPSPATRNAAQQKLDAMVAASKAAPAEPPIGPTVDDMRAILKKTGLNVGKLSDEQVMAKAKEMGLSPENLVEKPKAPPVKSKPATYTPEGATEIDESGNIVTPTASQAGHKNISANTEAERIYKNMVAAVGSEAANSVVDEAASTYKDIDAGKLSVAAKGGVSKIRLVDAIGRRFGKLTVKEKSALLKTGEWAFPERLSEPAKVASSITTEKAAPSPAVTPESETQLTPEEKRQRFEKAEEWVTSSDPEEETESEQPDIRDKSHLTQPDEGFHALSGGHDPADILQRISDIDNEVDRVYKNTPRTPKREAKLGVLRAKRKAADDELKLQGKLSHEASVAEVARELAAENAPSGTPRDAIDAASARLAEQDRLAGARAADTDIRASLEAAKSEALREGSSTSSGEKPAFESAKTGEGADGAPAGDLVQPGAEQRTRPEFGKPFSESERKLGTIGGGSVDTDEPTERKLRELALANAEVDKQREQTGREPMLRNAAKSDPVVWAEAMRVLADNPNAGDELVKSLIANPRPTSDVETMLLIHRMVAVRNEWERAIKQAGQAMMEETRAKKRGLNTAEYKSKADEALAREASLEAMVDEVDKADYLAGNQWGRSGRLRRLLVAEDYSLRSLIGRAVKANAGEAISEADKLQFQELSDQIKDLQEKLGKAEEALAKSKPVIDTEAQQKAIKEVEQKIITVQGDGEQVKALQDELAALKEKLAKTPLVTDSAEYQELEAQQVASKRKQGEAEKKIAAYGEKHKPLPRKIGDWLIKARVMEVISGLATNLKVGTSALNAIAVAPADQLMGSMIRLLPGFKQIDARAPVEGGGFNPAIEAKVVNAIATDGLKAIKDTFWTGQSDIDAKYGDRQNTPYTWADMLGGAHAAEKAPAAQGAFERTRRTLLERERAAGRDSTSAGAVERAELAAYKEGQRAKFQEDRVVVDGYNKFVEGLRSDKNAVPTQMLGTAMKLLTPVVRTPTNVVAQTFERVFGTLTGSIRMAAALRQGIETLKPEQADLIMRSMKRGTLGIPLFALGYWLGPTVLGGFYSGRRKESEPKPETIQTPIGTAPALTQHHPLMLIMQLGAAVRRAERDHPKEGFAAATKDGLKGLMEEVPLIREQFEVEKVFREEGFKSATANLAKSFAVPQLLSQFAAYLDQDAKGNTVQRETKTPWQAIQSGIPVVRQTLPKKKVGR